ncbi:MAG: hypothetical protein ACJ8GN_30380 [Longimicrobiaceae bacterium]
MTLELLPGAHPDEGALVRLLDGEADAAERASHGAHVGGCELCRRELARVRARRERLAALLVRADFPMPASSPPEPGVIRFPRVRPEPARRMDRRWLRAAAAVLLLVAAAAVATPARAWIAEWLGERWAALTHRTSEERRPVPAPAPAPPAPAQAVSSSKVSFVPGGSELRVEFAQRQAAGALTLVAVDGDAAYAEVLGSDVLVDVLVGPSGVRIRNDAGMTVGYRVAVPAGVRRVRLRVGGAERVVARADIGPVGWAMPLGR